MVQNSKVTIFGEELRRAREERGLAVESLCDATKVPLRHIRALETGAYDQLPGGVFRRGFVRSYISALGLEEADWMRRFEDSCRASGLRDPSGADWAAFAENVKNNRSQTYRRVGIGGMLAVLLLAALALAGWCAWRVKTHRSIMPVRVARLMQNSRSSRTTLQ
jgi:cytoskeletal protein RodZ